MKPQVSAIRSSKRRKLPRRVVADLVRRVVEASHPNRIILFGSAARGEMSLNSDVDLLVVKRGRFDRGRLIEAIYRNLRGVEVAVDVVVATPDELERFQDADCLVIAPALREGISVYEA
jgi:predicted nucleotidyltransferase